MSLAAFALVASPVLAFLGALLGHRLSRTSALELDRWRKREETMRLLRWGIDIALSQRDQARASVGIGVLDALLYAPILDDEDKELVSAIASASTGVQSGTLVNEKGRPP